MQESKELPIIEETTDFDQILRNLEGQEHITIRYVGNTVNYRCPTEADLRRYRRGTLHRFIKSMQANSSRKDAERIISRHNPCAYRRFRRHSP